MNVNSSKRLLSLLIVVMLLLGNGCARILAEKMSPTIRHPNVLYFTGTRAGIAFSMYICYEAGLLLLPVVVPCEIVGDILFLPADVARHVYYVCNPPLNQLIHDGNLSALAQRLAQGEDPNDVDFHYAGIGFSPQLPLMTALYVGNLEAFTMLLDHGAEVPLELFKADNLRRVFWPDTPDNYIAFFNAAFQHGISEVKINSIAAEDVIPKFLGGVELQHIHEKECFDKYYTMLSLLLDIGFTPNKIWNNWAPTTALDNLLAAPPSENREKLIALMRAHGAKTYDEQKIAKPDESLPPEIDPETVPDCFKPVIDILADKDPRREHARNYRFSAAYPGVEGPVVVVDWMIGGNKNRHCRKVVTIHRRETPTRWSQHGEPFDIPASFRLVLTPSGIRVPSRLPANLPKEDIIHEEWVTLPTCELYMERNPQSFHYDSGEDAKWDIKHIRELNGSQHESDERHERKRVEQDPINQQLTWRIQEENTRIQKEYEWEKEAAATAKMAGMKGIWLARRGSQDYFYSSHRDLRYLDRNSDHRVPYPDEIIALIETTHASLFTKDAIHDYTKEHKGDYYWNCQVHEICHKGSITLYYGDEVEQEELANVVKMARTLMKW